MNGGLAFLTFNTDVDDISVIGRTGFFGVANGSDEEENNDESHESYIGISPAILQRYGGPQGLSLASVDISLPYAYRLLSSPDRAAHATAIFGRRKSFESVKLLFARQGKQTTHDYLDVVVIGQWAAFQTHA